MLNIAVLIPSYNNDEPIVETIDMISTEVYEKMASKNINLYIFSIFTPGPNGSIPDYKSIQKYNPNFSYLIEKRKGYGRAYKTGFDRVINEFDLIITSDADGTYPLNQLEYIIDELITNDIDFLSVSRLKTIHRNSFSFIKKFGNIFLTHLINKIFDIKLRDSQSGMWIISKNVLERIQFENLGDGMEFSYQIKILAYKHPMIKFKELELDYYPRKGGKSKINIISTPIQLLFSIFKFRKIMLKYS